MSHSPGDHISSNSLSCLKAEADARAMDERADHAFGWEPHTIDADKRANEQGGRGARLVGTQRDVA